MSIVFFCQSCGSRFEVDPRMAGKQRPLQEMRGADDGPGQRQAGRRKPRRRTGSPLAPARAGGGGRGLGGPRRAGWARSMPARSRWRP